MAQSNRRWCSYASEFRCDNREPLRVTFALDCCDRSGVLWVPQPKGETVSGDTGTNPIIARLLPKAPSGSLVHPLSSSFCAFGRRGEEYRIHFDIEIREGRLHERPSGRWVGYVPSVDEVERLGIGWIAKVHRDFYGVF